LIREQFVHRFEIDTACVPESYLASVGGDQGDRRHALVKHMRRHQHNNVRLGPLAKVVLYHTPNSRSLPRRVTDAPGVPAWLRLGNARVV